MRIWSRKLPKAALNDYHPLIGIAFKSLGFRQFVMIGTAQRPPQPLRFDRGEVRRPNQSGAQALDRHPELDDKPLLFPFVADRTLQVALNGGPREPASETFRPGFFR